MSEPMAGLITAAMRPRGPSRDALSTLEVITQKAIDGDLASLAIAFVTQDGRPGSTFAIDGGDMFQVMAALQLAQHRVLGMVSASGYKPKEG